MPDFCVIASTSEAPGSSRLILLVSVVVYMIVTVAIGLYAATRVKDSKDFMVAGRSLPLYMNFACVFATWFGAETVLSVSAKFAHKGLGFVSGDPFGAALCLIIVAVFFARTFYRLELMTIGDYYHMRYGKFVEVITSLGIASSYLGWTSAQLSALGLVIKVLFPELELNEAIVIGAVIVTIYTLFGGMWSVALTDVVQTAAIVAGLIIVAVLLSYKAGGPNVVLAAAAAEGKLTLFPHVTTSAWMIFIGEFITMALGSIPQQDVFQRVTSAKNEKTAFIGTLCGGLFYFAFAFVPMFIAYSSTVINPEYAAHFHASDPREVQQILPNLILNDTPIWCQILFFGALLSAILSTASGTLLAPASVLTENVLQQFTKHFSDKTMLWLLRSLLVLVAIVSTTISVNSESTMYEMVESGYSVTLVVAFVPLVFGVYWRRATTQGAVFSILLALPVWIGAEYLLVDKPTTYVVLCETSSAVTEDQRNQQSQFVEELLTSLGDEGEFHFACVDADAAWASPKAMSATTDNSQKVRDFLKGRIATQPLSIEKGLAQLPNVTDTDVEVVFVGSAGTSGLAEGLKQLVGPADKHISLNAVTVGQPADKSFTEALQAVGGQVHAITEKHTPKSAVTETVNAVSDYRSVLKPWWQCVPPQLYGLVASLVGMILGSLMPNWIKHRQPTPEELAAKRGVAMGH